MAGAITSRGAYVISAAGLVHGLGNRFWSPGDQCQRRQPFFLSLGAVILWLFFWDRGTLE